MPRSRSSTMWKWFACAALVLGLGLRAIGQPAEMAVAEGVQKVLPGYRFNKRLATPTADDHLLLFSKGRDTALIAWTDGAGKRVSIPASPMEFAVFNTRGDALGAVVARDFVLNLVLAQEPGIYVPLAPNPLLQIAALAERIPPQVTVRGPRILELNADFVNPLEQPLILNPPGKPSVALKPGDTYTVGREVLVGRQYEPLRVDVGASGIMQTVTIRVENPIVLDMRADLPGRLTVDLVNPSGEAATGRLALELVGQEGSPPFEFPVDLKRGDTVRELQVPLGVDLPLPSAVRLVLRGSVGDPRREVVIAKTPAMQFFPVAHFLADPEGSPRNWQLARAGDSFADLRSGTPPRGAPWADQGTLILAYKLGQPGAAISVRPAGPAASSIIEKPASIGLWIHGDGTGNDLSMRWRDGTGSLFETDPRALNWKGWRYVNFPLPDEMQPPIRWEDLLRLTGVNTSAGAIMASGPVLTYLFHDEESATRTETSVEVEEDVRFGDPVRLDRSQVERGQVPLEFVPASPGQ